MKGTNKQNDKVKLYQNVMSIAIEKHEFTV